MHLKLRAARYQKFHLVICLGPNKQGSSVVSVFSSNFTTETRRFSQRHRETLFFRQTPSRASSSALLLRSLFSKRALPVNHIVLVARRIDKHRRDTCLQL